MVGIKLGQICVFSYVIPLSIQSIDKKNNGKMWSVISLNSPQGCPKNTSPKLVVGNKKDQKTKDIIISHQRVIVKNHEHSFHISPSSIDYGSAGLNQMCPITSKVQVKHVMYLPHSVKYFNSLACMCSKSQYMLKVIYIHIPIIANTL